MASVIISLRDSLIVIFKQMTAILAMNHDIVRSKNLHRGIEHISRIYCELHSSCALAILDRSVCSKNYFHSSTFGPVCLIFYSTYLVRSQ